MRIYGNLTLQANHNIKKPFFTIFAKNNYTLKQYFSLIIVLLIFNTIIYSQENYPKNYFISPIEIPIILSGTFGELRSNHFHSGVDIKTQKKDGLNLLAVADGYVSRIKVSQYGFGKALYITHPNGYTSVYAHLSKYSKKINDYVKRVQYKKEDYQTGNLFFDKDVFPVKKGEVIGYSGNTGSSTQSHLHFEIRNTETENIINPMLFGLEPKDTIAPVFESVKGYPLNTNSRIENFNDEVILPLKMLGKRKYTTDRISASGIIGFGVSVFDRLNKANNKNGVYSLEMLINGKRVYYHDVETFSFAESKYINLHIDYKHYKEYKKKYQKLFKETANKMSIYKELIDDGNINIKEGFNYNIQIIAKDYHGNSSILEIPIVGSRNNPIFSVPIDTLEYKIVAKNFHRFTKENVTVSFPKNTFYNDTYIDFKVEDGIARIHNTTIPLNKSYTIKFNVYKYSELEKQQLYIANLRHPKHPSYQETKKKDSIFYTRTKELGDYTLISDKDKPEIKLLYFKDKQWISKLEYLQVKISDKGSGIKDYRATIDGEWILMEYDHKKNILTYDFNDKDLFGSEHIFRIVVSDNAGNTNELSVTFFRVKN